MKLNKLGRSDLLLSALGWGTVKLGRNQAVKYPSDFDLPSDDEALQLLSTLKDCGINYLDTAPAYGNSEQRLGKLLKRQRHDFVISSKAGEEFDGEHSTFNFTPAHMRFSVERSLRRLATDYIDLLLVHSDGNDLEIIERYEVFDTLAELKRAGLIRAFGMSGKTIEGGLLSARHCDAVMVSCNPDYLDEMPVIEACYQQGTGVLIKKALASGQLAQADARDRVEESLSLLLPTAGVTSVVLGSINPKHLRANAETANRAYLQIPEEKLHV